MSEFFDWFNWIFVDALSSGFPSRKNAFPERPERRVAAASRIDFSTALDIRRTHHSVRALNRDERRAPPRIHLVAPSPLCISSASSRPGEAGKIARSCSPSIRNRSGTPDQGADRRHRPLSVEQKGSKEIFESPAAIVSCGDIAKDTTKQQQTKRTV